MANIQNNVIMNWKIINQPLGMGDLSGGFAPREKQLAPLVIAGIMAGISALTSAGSTIAGGAMSAAANNKARAQLAGERAANKAEQRRNEFEAWTDTAKGQNIMRKLRETVNQIWKKEMLLMDEDDNELFLPKQNQIPTDFYRKGDTVRAVVVQVDNKNQNPKIILSRTSPLFLQRLFEQEVPEVHDGLIAIKNIARIPGERAKVAVESFDERIDPVGACVGVKGARIHGIVRELRNENIDVINYTSNPNLYIQRALSPAKISSMNVNVEEKKADVYLKPDEVSLAIGKGGFNIKLASMLTGYQIDVYREMEEQDIEDIYLDEFNDEIDQWVLDAFKAIGLDTAKSVLAKSKEELLKQTDLEEETIDEVLRILNAEFEEEPVSSSAVETEK